ncbi:unnamed protein product [Lymnaea stagnalis]|uniref:SH3 domain-binding protein 5-like n=1 Tax=Lymnaea stagnalis TaxID=6523 RepID=A0AAV2HVU3_LYMST
MSDSYISQSPPSHYIHHHHHHIRRHRTPSGGEEHEEEELDPRIQIELEKLNRASEEINRLELELDDARAAFRTVLSDSTQRLNGLAKKLGACVDKARPYYDARMRLKEAHLESQKAALRFERACSMHEAAKEMVQLAEEGYKRREQDLDPTWQEMLNHATMKVNDAERERIESEAFHQQTTLNFKHREEEVQKLQKDLKRNITKSKPYFEMKAKFNQVMEEHKRAVSRLEEDVASSKALYSQALRSLEAISDDIHRQRLERRQKLELGVRGAGVGAESPSPPPSWEKGSNIEGSASSHTFHRDVDSGPRGKTSRSFETVLNVSHLNSKPTGIVCHEPAFRKKTSITESLLKDGIFKPDPLDVVVFKTVLSDCRESSPGLKDMSAPPGHHSDTSQTHGTGQDSNLPCVIYPNRTRSSSYRAAIEMSGGTSQGGPGWSRSDSIVEGLEDNENANVGAPVAENLKPLSFEVHDSAKRQHEFHKSSSMDKESNASTLSCSPSGSHIRDMELSQSSVRRAQEWVNKSPVPQQRSFVKSKSLIDASCSSLSVDQSPNQELSSSLTSDLMRAMTRKPTYEIHWPPVLQPPSLHTLSISTLSGVPTSDGSPDTTCQPSSPTLHRKSPKLQGLILRVDPAGLNSSSGHSPINTSSNSATSSIELSPKPMITTQQLGYFVDKSGHPLATSQPSQTPVPRPPTSLITQHLNKVMNVAKVSSYSSKTAPSTLSASYTISNHSSNNHHSPTWNPPPTHVQPPSASLRHQLTSPTPSSPSADRISSGRSDTMSVSSNRGAFLKPPSDSSDTESIASTGPMLDDDQVELINMDFSENSIITESNDDSHCYEDRSAITRGHWSRLSLPPRLSYLEGFLERARMFTGEACEKSDPSSQQDDMDMSESSTNGSHSCQDKSDVEDIEDIIPQPGTSHGGLDHKAALLSPMPNDCSDDPTGGGSPILQEDEEKASAKSPEVTSGLDNSSVNNNSMQVTVTLSLPPEQAHGPNSNQNAQIKPVVSSLRMQLENAKIDDNDKTQEEKLTDQDVSSTKTDVSLENDWDKSEYFV